jgi:hypothetical protein
MFLFMINQQIHECCKQFQLFEFDFKVSIQSLFVQNNCEFDKNACSQPFGKELF